MTIIFFAFYIIVWWGSSVSDPLLINARGSRQGPVAGPLGRSLFLYVICIVLIFSVAQTELAVKCMLVHFTLHTCSD